MEAYQFRTIRKREANAIFICVIDEQGNLYRRFILLISPRRKEFSNLQ